MLKTIFREKFRAAPLPLAPHGEEHLRQAMAMPIRPTPLVAVPIEDGHEAHARFEATSAAPSEIVAAR